jgi:PAS domain-containing protein
VIRRVYVGRLAIVVAIYVAAVYAWRDADSTDTLVASLLMTTTLAFTAAAATWSEIYGRPLTARFLTIQSLFDLLAVTAIVQVTGVAASQFAALYILAIAYTSLTLTTSRSLAVAALGCLLYAAAVLWRSPDDLVAVWLQLGIFVAVALSSGYIGARLREARAGTEELVAQLHKARLQASDILRNIRSGIITVDARGTLLYANPAASQLLALRLDDRVGTPILDDLEPISPVLPTRGRFPSASTPRSPPPASRPSRMPRARPPPSSRTFPTRRSSTPCTCVRSGSRRWPN